jgi:hypothetical protein
MVGERAHCCPLSFDFFPCQISPSIPFSFRYNAACPKRTRAFQGGTDMREMLITAVCLLLFASAAAQSKKPQPQTGPPAKLLEAKVRKTWEDYKNKNKDGFAAILADGFREVEEDSSGFADRKAILEEMDQLELSQYTLKDFDTRPAGVNAALVTYMADYSGKVAGEPLQAKCVYGEVWTKQANEWKLLYVQETRVK